MPPRDRAFFGIIIGILLIALTIVLLAGCTPLQQVAAALAGQPAVTSTDANGVTVVVTPATPGLIPPVAESLAAVAAALGIPFLAIWIRKVGKAAKATADAFANGNNHSPKSPPDAPA
jgi:ABC-type Fe3+-hydroxamate transport system substrate-binding protein